ncbi:MAG: hypothetical protein ACI9XP_001197 [Lentimonas sp.]|jgi:hypothetical protein
MAIEKIYTRGKSKFSERIEMWCAEKNFEFSYLDKEDKNMEELDSLVIFHEDHNLDSVALELRVVFEKKLKPIHKIDVNGTKQVSISHFGLWVERNNCKNLLLVGTDTLIESDSFETLLSKMA